MNQIPAPTGQNPENDLRRYLRILRRWKWILALCVILPPVVAYFLLARQPKKYQASATVQIQPIGPSPATDAGVTARSVAAALRLADTAQVADAAATQLRNPRFDGLRVLHSVAFSADSVSGFVTITASAPHPQLAADLANAYANAFQATRTADAVSQIDAAILQSTRAVGALGSRKSTTATASQLDQLQPVEQLRVARAEQATATQVIAPALPPSSPSSPKPFRAAAVALVLGILGGVVLIFLVNKLDTRIREIDEVEGLVGGPPLGTIPAAAFPGHRDSPQVREGFQMLRARLTTFNVRPMRSMLVTSPMAGDGKTTVTTHLALAYARSGRAVIVVDADLRHPDVGARLTGNQVAPDGLGAVIAGQCELADAVEDIEIDGTKLRILPAGPTPPNPSELLASDQMRRLLPRLEEEADLVLIDTSPVMAVGDAIPLLEQVAGVLVVAKLGVTPRKALSELVSVVGNARGSLLGSVITGARDRASYGYYGYGYGVPSPNGARAEVEAASNNKVSAGVDHLGGKPASASDDA